MIYIMKLVLESANSVLVLANSSADLGKISVYI